VCSFDVPESDPKVHSSFFLRREGRGNAQEGAEDNQKGQYPILHKILLQNGVPWMPGVEQRQVYSFWTEMQEGNARSRREPSHRRKGPGVARSRSAL
jgi:hypothetical protein